MTKVYFAQNFKKLRAKKGLTQDQIADELMITRHSVGSYEESRATPKYDKLINIAVFFGITVDQLIREEVK